MIEPIKYRRIPNKSTILKDLGLAFPVLTNVYKTIDIITLIVDVSSHTSFRCINWNNVKPSLRIYRETKIINKI